MSGLFDDFDPGDLAGTGLVEESADDHSALQLVASRISAQYGEVISAWSRRALSSREPAKVSGVRANVKNLLRLAESSGNEQQAVLLRDLDATLVAMEGTTPNTRAGDQARVRLRDWIPSFAETLEGADKNRLITLVQWDTESAPFLDELLQVRGVGKRRLTRLYSAGLGQLDALASADATEVAEVTGIPFLVVEDIIATAARWAVEERTRCVEDIRERAMRLEMLMTRIQHHPNQELVRAAQDALQHVEVAFQTLFVEEES